MELSEAVSLAIIFTAGGVVKGMLGIGLPAFLIGLLTFQYEPRFAMAMILLVILFSNMRQAMVGGPIWPIVLRHKYFCLCACVGIFWVAYFGAAVPTPPLQICVGVAMVIFAFTSLLGAIPPMQARFETGGQMLAGLFSGVLGGLTAIWGPPLALYLMSLRLDKNVLIQTMGVMFAAQAVFLTLGFVVTGELTAQIASVGAILLIPTFVGMYLGERFRHRLNTQQFSRLFLVGFILLGLNLIRRGVFGA